MPPAAAVGTGSRAVTPAAAPLLARGRVVLAVDLRGHGEAPGDEGFSLPDMAADVAHTLGALDFGRVAVVGMSIGGCVAQAMATGHPEFVASLGLVDTTAWYGPDAPQTWGGRADRALQDGLDSLSGFQLARWFGEGFLADKPEVGERLLETFRANHLPSYASACRAAGAFVGRARLADVAASTVVVVGELDPARDLSMPAAYSRASQRQNFV